MDEQKNCIFVQRKEFTTILVYILYPAIYQGLKSIWDETKRTVKAREVFAHFQHKLTRVPKWNQDVIESEYNRIIDKTKCIYIEDLIKRVFVLNTQILAAVNINSIDPNRKIKVKVPKGEKFVHHCYKECARAFYENVLLMEDRPGSISRVEQSKNLQKAYKLIMTCIENTIRNMLPIESLLKNTMDEDGEGEDATPPPMLFQSTSQKVEQPPSILPSRLSTFPTIGSFLQQQGNLNDNINPSNSGGSLQPSMNDLGSIPLQSDTHKKISSFDPESLFEPRHDMDKEDGDRKINMNGDDMYNDRSKDRDMEDNRDDDRDRNDRDGEDRDRDRDRNGNDRDGEDRGREDNNKEEKSGEENNSIFKPSMFRLPSFDNRKAAPVEDTTKTIFFGKKSSFMPTNMDSRKKDDANSEASDIDMARSSHNIGGEDMDGQHTDFPIVRKSRPEQHIDLDVYSSNNELPLESSKKEEKSTIDMESSKQSVPPYQDMERENFFSDVE